MSASLDDPKPGEREHTTAMTPGPRGRGWIAVLVAPLLVAYLLSLMFWETDPVVVIAAWLVVTAVAVVVRQVRAARRL